MVGSSSDITDHIMMSPPVAFMPFDDIAELSSTGLIITGQNDDIASPDMIRAHMDRWQITPQFDIIPGRDHFYAEYLGSLHKSLSRYFS